LRKFAHSQVDALLRKLAAQVKRAGDESGADAIHDLRVAVRRLSRGLRSLAQFFAGKACKRIRKELSELMDAAGAVRDNDIALELVRKAGIAEGSRIVPALETRRREAEQDLRDRLQAWREKKVARHWREELGIGERAAKPAKQRTQAPWNQHLSAKANARRELPRMMRAYFAEVRELRGRRHSLAELHKVRLASKKIRYTLEMFRPYYAAAAFEERMEALKGVQNSLGEVNDSVAASALLAKLIPHSPQRRAARRFLNERAAKKAEEFRVHWTERFDSPGQERWWTDFLGGRHAAKTGVALRARGAGG
jgi:CHAD domain-containing protein